MLMNLVPVDYVAQAVARLAFDPRALGLTFHLTVGAEHLPQVRQLLETARQWAADHLGTPLFLTDTDGAVVWRGEYRPFGEVFSEDKDPDGLDPEVEFGE